MSALRHGKIERAIATEIARAAKPSFGGVSSVLIRSRQLVDEVYRPKGGSGGWDWDWKPMPAQRKGFVRAMPSQQIKTGRSRFDWPSAVLPRPRAIVIAPARALSGPCARCEPCLRARRTPRRSADWSSRSASAARRVPCPLRPDHVSRQAL